MSRFKQYIWAVLTIGILLTTPFYPIQRGVAGQPQASGGRISPFGRNDSLIGRNDRSMGRNDRLLATAASLSLTPSSAAPGATILLKGAGFTTGPSNVTWDAQNGRPLGLGQLGPNGDFALPIMIPPDASEGQHIVWASNGRDFVSTSVKVLGPNRTAVYLYTTDDQSATNFKELLDANGILTDLLPVDLVSNSTDFSPYSLILIGHETGNMNTWGSPAALQRLAQTGKPVLGLGEGGYAYFGKRGLRIGYPWGGHTELKNLSILNDQEPVYHTPYRPALQGGIGTPYYIEVYSSPAPVVDINLENTAPGTYPFGRDLKPDANYYPVIQQGRSLFWGFEVGPSAMTSDGRWLFINLAWHLLTALEKDTLVLTDPSRFPLAGYTAAQVADMNNAINSLVGLPSAKTNMKAVLRDLEVQAPAAVKNAYISWTLSSVPSTNNLATEIDKYVENLKGGVFPNLKYVLLVGAHDIIPMKARAADNHHENGWGIPAPLVGSGYMNAIIQSTYNGALGYYLTDTIYGDLSYYADGWGVYHELVPELAVGRLVETPAQITNLVNNYIASNASLSRALLASIASNDYMDGGQAAVNFMGTSTDGTLIQAGFNSSLVPPKINLKNDIIYIGGHGNYNWMTTGSGQGFMAGATASQGDTEELSNLANAVIAASGCHNGFNITSMHQTYTGNTDYGDFPERFAEKGVGVYLGSTGYTWISISGSSMDISYVWYSERVTTLFLDRLLNHGLTTAGAAFQQAVSQYATEVGNLGDGAARRAIAIATLYGIPNYRFPILVAPAALKAAYSIKTTPWFLYPLNPGEVNRAQLTLELDNWNVTPNGLVEIPGARYIGDKNHPILPLINVSQLLPESGGVVTPTLNLSQSRFITLTNDIPLPKVGTFDGERVVIDPGTFREQGFFPATGIYTDTQPIPGGGGIGLGLNIIPVQYDKDLHQTRIWTRLVFDLETRANAGAGGEDTDGDELPDYWEISFGLDPYDPLGDHGARGDPDQDGLTNLDEFKRGTNPLNPDTDRDGVNDGQEVALGSDPLDPGSPKWIYLPLIKK